MQTNISVSTKENHQFNQSILREYDIRGVVGETLSSDDIYFIGKAFGTIVQRLGEGKNICLGYDGRTSSKEFSEQLAAGLKSTGINVEIVGLGPTPLVWYALMNRDNHAGVMITGSHSPLEYNGVKMSLRSRPFYGEDVQDVGRVAKAGDFLEGEGSIKEVEIKEDYLNRLLHDYEPSEKELKIVWDAGNGAGGELMTEMTKRIKGEHHLLFADIDGSFPNHHPDPTVAKNLVDIQNTIKEHGCDLGIGFDGDADRIGIVDENGTIYWADILIAIYAQEILETHPNSYVISDVKSSSVLFDEIERLGGKPIMWNTGHSLIKDKMKELKSPLAGELAGHICFGDKFYGYDDGLYCAIRLLNIMHKTGKKLSELTSHLPKMFNTPEVRLHVDADKKLPLINAIKENLKSFADIKVNDIDGVRVDSKDGWWLIRQSNTEDVISFRAESKTEEGLKTLQNTIVEQLQLNGVEFKF